MLRTLKFLLKRALSLFLTLVIAVYITILIANAGGYVDEIMKSEIRMNIAIAVANNPAYSGLPASQLEKIIETQTQSAFKRLGLDKPFFIRSFYYLRDALTLDLGRAYYMTSDSGSRRVKLIILERLPQTILLFTTATVLIFFINMMGGLYLSRRYGSKPDKLLLTLAPLSSIPGWFYLILLILIFYTWLHVLPPGGLVDYPPPPDKLGYFLSVLKHMILPLSAWIISYTPIGIYSMRNFFLIFSTEDYVEVAKAKGLPSRQIEYKYILRPALPPIITSFALSVIASWTGAIITETVYGWPGLGYTIAVAIGLFDAPVIVGVTVMYAYLLVVTVFILDLVYGLIDPRIRVGG
ncbi:MAG: ABC transporter permease [Thermoproteota archaeon]|nr:MAG: ABC transporter permease [Candidatus Korarchaeota archaeon]RLG54455.1 MAG: ABC transporter permease [Candidatus Korarchaeota archaeon]